MENDVYVAFLSHLAPHIPLFILSLSSFPCFSLMLVHSAWVCVCVCVHTFSVCMYPNIPCASCKNGPQYIASDLRTLFWSKLFNASDANHQDTKVKKSQLIYRKKKKKKKNKRTLLQKQDDTTQKKCTYSGTSILCDESDIVSI